MRRSRRGGIVCDACDRPGQADTRGERDLARLAAGRARERTFEPVHRAARRASIVDHVLAGDARVPDFVARPRSAEVRHVFGRALFLLRAGRERERDDQMAGKNAMASLVRKKSAIRIVIEITTTVRVVLFPTPAVPPVVVRPK